MIISQLTSHRHGELKSEFGHVSQVGVGGLRLQARRPHSSHFNDDLLVDRQLNSLPNALPSSGLGTLLFELNFARELTYCTHAVAANV